MESNTKLTLKFSNKLIPPWTQKQPIAERKVSSMLERATVHIRETYLQRARPPSHDGLHICCPKIIPQIMGRPTCASYYYLLKPFVLPPLFTLNTSVWTEK